MQWLLRPTRSGFPLAIIAHLQTHWQAPSRVFEKNLPHLLLRNNSNLLGVFGK